MKKNQRWENWPAKFLVATLALQILFALLWNIRFPVPAFLIQEINNVTVPEGLFIEIDEVTFTLGGKIGVRNARMKPTAKDTISLCFIRRLDAHIKIASLLTGRFVPTHVVIDDARFLGGNQEINPVMENFSGILSFREEIIRFAFKGHTLASKLDFRGLWNTEMAFSQRRVAREKKTSILLREDFLQMYWQAMKWSQKAKVLLAKAEQPIIEAHLTVKDQCRIRLVGESGATRVGFYEAESGYCYTDTEINADREIESSLLLVTKKLHWDSGSGELGIGHIRARVDQIKYNSQEITKLPKIDAKLEGLSLSGKFDGRLPSVYFEASPTGTDSFDLFAAMGTNESKIIFAGTTEPLERNVQGTFSITARPHDLTSTIINEWSKKQMLHTPNPITATIGPMRIQDGDFSGSKFIIKAEELTVKNSPPARYRIHGKINPDGSILAHDIYGKLKHSEVQGSFRQNWSNLDFRFLLEGHSMPTEINPWLRDWWDTIWQDFSWDKDIPYGDFDIQGQWLSKNRSTRTYGAVEVSNIDYKGLPLDKCTLKVIVDEKKTEITEIKLFPPTGKVEGKLSFPRSSSNQPLILGFDVNGEMNPAHGRRAFGSVAEKVLARFDTNSTVKVLAKGQVLLAKDLNRSDNDDLTNFRIQATAHNPISFSGMPLEYLSLDLQSSAEQTHIEKLDFGIAGGRGSGSLLFHEEQNGSELDIKLSVHKVNRSTFVEAMTLSDAFSEDNDSSLKDPSEKLTNGLLDLSLEVSGRTNEIWSFDGNGSILISDPDLGKVRLFGSLADLIGKNSLGSVRFTKLETPFILNRERVTFKNLNLSGNTSLLVANGDVNLPQGLLDFEARLHLLGNIPLIKKLTQLADPLSALANIKIGGSFDKPTWNVQFRPGKAPLEVLFPDGIPSPRKAKGN